MAEGNVPTEGLLQNVLTIEQQIKRSEVPRGSGYEQIIIERQKSRPDNMPDAMANEMVKLYPDLSWITRALPEENRKSVIDKLNVGDLKQILYLAQMVKKKYLSNRDFDEVRKKVLRGQSVDSVDLKIVLADQLINRIRTQTQQSVEQEQIPASAKPR